MVCTYELMRPRLLSQLPYGVEFQFKRGYKAGEYYRRSQPHLRAIYKKINETTFLYKSTHEHIDWDVSGMDMQSAITHLNKEIEVLR